MESIRIPERSTLEQYLGMASGYVLDLSDREFGELCQEAVGADIHSERYCENGTSKAKKLRAFWQIESDYAVGQLVMALVEHEEARQTIRSDQELELAERCKAIARRLLTSSTDLARLGQHAATLDARYLAQQVQRMELAIQTDPSLAIGTAKELIETCCKTILAELGDPASASVEMPALTRATMKALNLVPHDVPDQKRGAETIRRILSNLATVAVGVAELRNLYGTGHGKHGNSAGLSPRHAKLVVGAAATLVTFLFETHTEIRSRQSD